MALTHTTDHEGEALDRLAEQFKAGTNLRALISAAAAQTQALEDVLWALFSERLLDAAVGDQLDNLGAIVGQERGTSADDDEYRLRIRARLAANRSSGTPEDIFTVFRALLGDVDAVIEFDSGFPAGFVVRLPDEITAAQAAVGTELLGDAKAAGVKAILEWSESAEADRFTTSLFTRLSVSRGSGTAPLQVVSTAGFPSSGTIIMAEGTADEQTITYTGKTSTTFTGVSGTSGTTPQYSSVTLVDATAGKGFGDDSNAALGGNMTGAAEGE